MEVRKTLERELKLGVDEDFELPELPGDPLPPEVFTSTYFDTGDHRLARVAVTLRRRVYDERGVWQLKLPHGDARLEVEVAEDSDHPPERLRDVLLAHTRGDSLVPVATLRTRRIGRRVKKATALADVVLDSVSVLDAGRVSGRFRELEIELVEGDDGALGRLEKVLRGAGAHDADGRPKVFQALGLALPNGAPPVSSDDANVAQLQAALRAQLSALLAHDPGARLGDDPEDLHQMRVAIRRLRALLRAARPMLERRWTERLRAELEWLGDALGPSRDLDVQLAHLRAETESLEGPEAAAFAPFLGALERERGAVRERLLEALRSERYFILLERLETCARYPMVVDADVSLTSVARKQFKRLRKAVRRLGDAPTDPELHAVRIKAKRARYAAELADARAGKAAKRFLRQAKRLQDVLGEHQDAAIAEQRIRQLVAGAKDGQAGIAAGRLLERQRARRARARADFPRAWAKLEKRGRKAWA